MVQVQEGGHVVELVLCIMVPQDVRCDPMTPFLHSCNEGRFSLLPTTTECRDC